MDFGKVINKLREIKSQQGEYQELDENPRDVQLTSLRRMRNSQLIKEEKKKLKQQIRAYVKKEENELWGITNKKPGKMYGKFNKCNVLNNKKPLLKQPNPLKKNTKRLI
jgi:hypothetical protein